MFCGGCGLRLAMASRSKGGILRCRKSVADGGGEGREHCKSSTGRRNCEVRSVTCASDLERLATNNVAISPSQISLFWQVSTRVETCQFSEMTSPTTAAGRDQRGAGAWSANCESAPVTGVYEQILVSTRSAKTRSLNARWSFIPAREASRSGKMWSACR